MLTVSNKERLEREIGNLIGFITDGRGFFFAHTGGSLQSSDDFLNHFTCKQLFASHRELMQLDLNIQLLYIKLASYYQIVAKEKVAKLKKPRNAFAHELTDLIFSKRVKYNFFLHKVSENLNKVQYVFYAEDDAVESNDVPRVVELDLWTDINTFFAIGGWNKSAGEN